MGPHSIKVSTKKPTKNSKETRRKGRGGERICMQKKCSALLEKLGGNCSQDPQSFRKVVVRSGLPFLLFPLYFYLFYLCFSPLSLW